ncbi:MAG: hypothetical protein IMZ67_09205 [Acidobacteria bacterium]|nr:hypothetical protein [Acidobacteriota bacterium]
MSADPMNVYVARPDEDPVPACRVAPETFDRLRAMVAEWSWEPMLTADEDGYRAWLRQGRGRRMFGRPAATADQAARSLIAKVEPWVRS